MTAPGEANFFTISDADIAPLKDKVVIITGGASGIGLATIKLMLELGAKVVSGDVNPQPADLKSENLIFTNLDVTVWKQLSDLFKKAIEVHGKIDHVFANAGIGPIEPYIEDQFDDDGELLPPNEKVLQVNLLGAINTSKLGLHYIKKNPEGGSIVLTASVSSFQRFSPVDYTTAKHGVLGFLRGLTPLLHPHIPIRINALAPSWTETGIVPAEVGSLVPIQPPSAVARSVALVMADKTRHGQLIYSEEGKYMEIEEGMLEHVDRFMLAASAKKIQSIKIIDEVFVDATLAKVGVERKK